MVEKDIGRIKKGEYQGTVTEIVVGLREYNGKTGIDIREFTKSEGYTGPTKKGLRVPADKFEEFKTMINSIDPADLSASAPVEKAPLKVNPSEEPKEETSNEEEDAGIDEDGYM